MYGYDWVKIEYARDVIVLPCREWRKKLFLLLDVAPRLNIEYLNRVLCHCPHLFESI